MRRFNSREQEGGGGGDAASVEAAAVGLLARREHSTDELKRKLIGKGCDAAVVAAVVEKLREKQLVSDDRYAASLIRHRTGRGQGPMRIRADLRQQGVADATIDQGFGGTEINWRRRAAEVRLRKFGAGSPRSLSERAKQARFLQYRGFSADQIRAALSDADIDESLDDPCGERGEGGREGPRFNDEPAEE